MVEIVLGFWIDLHSVWHVRLPLLFPKILVRVILHQFHAFVSDQVSQSSLVSGDFACIEFILIVFQAAHRLAYQTVALFPFPVVINRIAVANS